MLTLACFAPQCLEMRSDKGASHMVGCGLLGEDRLLWPGGAESEEQGKEKLARRQDCPPRDGR